MVYQMALEKRIVGVRAGIFILGSVSGGLSETLDQSGHVSCPRTHS